ncbi:response regulator [Cypionkella sinensis]|uniref:Response regulator n=1 Tax=Cypionkella sinensis TaxID=1756043 RepID=A0ABV7J3H9_9RHOB
MRVYIADDNLEFSRFVRRVAEMEGWKATTCTNGRELAAEVAAEERAALLIVDINMPELDGIEVIEELKAIKRQLRIRFVTGGEITSAVAAQMIAKARGMDSGRLLFKPIAVEELKELFRSEAKLLYE